ncbi:MAG: YbbR-like domain-containing protein [Bacteroidales bacterium]|nr:YbbR-like domain-containing protein [Bacteroidales bacterium]
MNQLQQILNTVKKYLSKMDLKVYFICLLIATFIWLMMKLSEGYSKEIEIPIQYANYPEGMILVNKPSSSLKVEVESQGFKMITIALKNNKQVRLDLSKLELRRTRYKRWVASIPSHLFSYEISNQLGVSPVGAKVRPDSIFFVFDSLIVRELPVEVNAKLSFKEGNTLMNELLVEPSKVKVSGPALTLNAMNKVSADSLIKEQIDKDFEVNLKLKSTNEYVRFNPENVKVTASVAKFSEFSTTVPLIVESSIPNLKVKTFPANVTLTYSIPIPEYDNISDSSFVVIVHIDSLDVLRANHLIPKIIKKPKYVNSVYMDVDKVEFIVLKK